MFANTLQAAVKVGRISASDVHGPAAREICGQFSNVASGGRVPVYSVDQLDNLLEPVGTFRVTYDKTSLTLSNFQPK